MSYTILILGLVFIAAAWDFGRRWLRDRDMRTELEAHIARLETELKEQIREVRVQSEQTLAKLQTTSAAISSRTQLRGLR